MQSNKNSETIWEKIRPFVFGGLSGISGTIVAHPMDNIKVRIQSLNEKSGFEGSLKKRPTVFRTGKWMIKNQGFSTLYQGIDAGILRQIVYASVRLGVYKYIYQKRLEEIQRDGKGEITFVDRLLVSLFSGFVGSIIGNPMDLAMVRLQSELFLKPEERRNYKNVLDVLIRVPKEEGFQVFWRGFPSFSMRVMAITSTQLTTFDQLKLAINNLRGRDDSDFATRLLSVALTGLVASAVALPFDNIKMKLMKMVPDCKGVLPYKGMIDCAFKSVSREGASGLWVGYIGFWSLIAPHTMMSLITMDYLQFYFGSELMQKN